MNVIAYSLTSSGAAEWFASYALGGLENVSAFSVLAIVTVIGIVAHYILPASSAEVMVLTPVVCDARQEKQCRSQYSNRP